METEIDDESGFDDDLVAFADALSNVDLQQYLLLARGKDKTDNSAR